MLLDAHVSGRRIAAALRTAEHDVLALNEDAELGELDDPGALELAARDGRILVTFNHRDFVPLVREWAEAGRSHAGCIVVHGIDHGEFDLILHGLTQLLAERPRGNDWIGITDFLFRARVQ